MEAEALKGTPCEGAIARALMLAGQIVARDVEPMKGAREIAWLGSGDCYDFLNEIDVVDAMGGFWSMVDSWESEQDDPSARAAIADEIRREAQLFVEQFG